MPTALPELVERPSRHDGKAAGKPAACASVTAVTGAASGIGRAFAVALAGRGERLLLIDRAGAALRDLADQIVRDGHLQPHVVVVDLSNRDAANPILRCCHRHRLRVTTLINCAGIGSHAPFTGQSRQLMHDMIDVNIRSLVELTRLLLPRMIRQKSGRIVNVSSIAAFEPEAGVAVYAATKSFVQTFTESLYQELAGTGVHVTGVCPGITKTPFLSDSGLSEAHLSPTAQTPEQVVAEALRGIDRNQALVVTGSANRIRIWAQRVSLRSLATSVLRVVRRLRIR